MTKKILVGDDVIVLAGRDKGKVGKVVRIIKVSSKTRGTITRVIVSGVVLSKKSAKPEAGGIKQIERPIDVSNVAFFDSVSGSSAKVGYVFIDGKKKRCIKSSGKVIG